MLSVALCALMEQKKHTGSTWSTAFIPEHMLHIYRMEHSERIWSRPEAYVNAEAWNERNNSQI